MYFQGFPSLMEETDRPQGGSRRLCPLGALLGAESEPSVGGGLVLEKPEQRRPSGGQRYRGIDGQWLCTAGPKQEESGFYLKAGE